MRVESITALLELKAEPELTKMVVVGSAACELPLCMQLNSKEAVATCEDRLHKALLQ